MLKVVVINEGCKVVEVIDSILEYGKEGYDTAIDTTGTCAVGYSDDILLVKSEQMNHYGLDEDEVLEIVSAAHNYDDDDEDEDNEINVEEIDEDNYNVTYNDKIIHIEFENLY